MKDLLRFQHVFQKVGVGESEIEGQASPTPWTFVRLVYETRGASVSVNPIEMDSRLRV